MKMAEFHNALRIMKFIDRLQLEQKGVKLTDKQWFVFDSNPFEWFIRASDIDKILVWQIIDNQMQRKLSDG